MPTEQMSSANKPLSSEGRTYHVETCWGEVANRIVTVGDPQRARQMSQRLDKILCEHTSHRGFLTITGLYQGLPLSIVAIGMGLSMMDFFVRETRMVVEGPLVIVRLGSCGSICQAKTGDFIVANGAFGIQRNYRYFDAQEKEPYLLWPAVGADAGLTDRLADNLRAANQGGEVHRGMVGNGDGFYGSQGRLGEDFYDSNGALLEKIHQQVPDVAALEMESHMLFHLAKHSTGSSGDKAPSVRAACGLVVFADRTGNSFISPQKSKQMIELATGAVFDTLVQELPTQEGLHPARGSVWE